LYLIFLFTGMSFFPIYLVKRVNKDKVDPIRMWEVYRKELVSYTYA